MTFKLINNCSRERLKKISCKKIKLQNFPPPVFSNFDVVQQAYFKDKNTSALTSHLPPGRIMQKDEMPGRVVSETIKDNKGREFILGGRPDVVIEFDDGQYCDGQCEPGEVCEKRNIYNGHPGLITQYPQLKGKDPQQKAIDLGLEYS